MSNEPKDTKDRQREISDAAERVTKAHKAWRTLTANLASMEADYLTAQTATADALTAYTTAKTALEGLLKADSEPTA